jgi:uracil-DNA glycosylase family 4
MDTRVDLLFVGQMTGKTELAQGRPFRGPNSAVLREAFMAHGIGAEGGPTAYLTNLVKCVPAGDKPRAQVVHNCEGFLALEITALCPNIIVTLGVDAFRFFSGDSTPLKDVEGEPHPFGGKIIMPLKHPSAIHRIDDNKNRLKAMADFTEQIAGIVRMNAKYNELRVAGRVVSIDPEQLAIEE